MSCGKIDENKDICGETFTCPECRKDAKIAALTAELAAYKKDNPREGIFDRFEDYRCVSVFEAVKIERSWQDAKFGISDHENGRWLPILVEEVGESATAMNVANFHPKDREAALDNLEVELIQVAATAIAWVESLRRLRPNTPHEEAIDRRQEKSE